MAATLTINDPVFTPVEKPGLFRKLIMHFIRDERDIPFVKLSFGLFFMNLAFAVYLYYDFTWWAFIAVALNQAVFVGPFILMLHNTSHRKLYKQQYEFMNKFIPWCVGIFYGESPNTYFTHHIGMHHSEGNLPKDLSSTMKYQRDSVIDFSKYFLTFFFFGFFQLALYFGRRRRWKLFRKTVFGEMAYYALCVGLSFVNWKATLLLFIVPFFTTRLGMMAGNWGQHAFVDADDPGNDYKSSITCINSVYNKRCFNDGYHIGHHVKASRHWTEMPGDFLDNIDTYAREKAVVFEKLDFFVVWLLLMTKNYKKLARHFVKLDDSFKTEEEIIAFLKSRTRKIDISVAA